MHRGQQVIRTERGGRADGDRLVPPAREIRAGNPPLIVEFDAAIFDRALQAHVVQELEQTLAWKRTVLPPGRRAIGGARSRSAHRCTRSFNRARTSRASRAMARTTSPAPGRS